jgi:hypothetical protein
MTCLARAELPVFDLSKRAIVPIVSRVKTDPARRVSDPELGSQADGEQAGFQSELGCP